MNIEEYIKSGVLHDYCLDLLSDNDRGVVEENCLKFPQIKAELLSVQKAFDEYAKLAARSPAHELQQNIWSTLDNINKERHGDLTDLPLINKYSDYKHWKRIVLSLMPKEINTEKIEVLRSANGVTQVFFVSGKAIPDETHENERESFIVLEGECECCIGDKLIRLGPGGFIEIPMYTHHDVKAITPFVVAIMQRIAI